jgi:hypothetical protein
MTLYLLDDRSLPVRVVVADRSLQQTWLDLMKSINITVKGMSWILAVPKARNRSHAWDLVCAWAKVQGIPQHWFRRHRSRETWGAVAYSVRLYNTPRFTK